MSDVFDIGGSAYNNQRKSNEDYIHGRGNEWLPVDTHKDPRLSRRDKDGTRYSPSESPHYRGQQRSHSPQHDARWRSPKATSQMFNQQSHSQQYPSQVPPPPPPVYNEYNSAYGGSTTQYHHGYQQSFQQNSNNFNQYSQQRGYAVQASSSAQGYGSSHQHQPGPPGDDYPSSSWAPVLQHRQEQVATYTQMNHPQQPRVPQPPSVTTPIQSDIVKTDDFKKEAAIANEVKQQRATLIKQRDDYLRKASVLRRELDKLRVQKQDLVSEKSPARESQRILRENAKLQLEIQNKLKSIYNVIDMLSGIIGDGLKAVDLENKISCNDDSPKQQRSRKSSSRQLERDSDDSGSNNGVGCRQLVRAKSIRASTEQDEDQPQPQPRYNYVHYDPELHWCRICDVFPRTAKDLLTHLHSTEHRQVTQDHQLVDTPWHKLPVDPELPTYKGAPAKRVPIKGLQFFISATAWYCKLCDIWIGDLHCASLHLKSKNHAHNYSNFVEQNPHWESNWLKDREKAYARCAKVKQETSNAPFTQQVQTTTEKSKSKSRKSKGDFLDSGKEKKRKKKTKKRKKIESSGSSSSSSSSSNSSSEDESDKAKSIRVAMRNKMRMQAQMILNEELGNKVEVLEKLLGERNRKKDEPKSLVVAAPPPPPPPPPPPLPLPPPPPPDAVVEDNIINQWMTVNPTQDKHIFDHLKDRLKQRQKADEEKVMEAAAEQRRRDREREERELKELREREQKEIEDKLREKEQEELRIKEREKFSRRKRDSRSPDYYNNRRSQSKENSRSNKRHYSGHSNDRYSAESPNEKFKPKSREYDEEESQFDKRYSESFKFKQNKNQDSSSKKLPFIGRMPLFKKKSSDSGGSNTNEHNKSNDKKMKQDYQVRLSKFESGITARPFIPEPGVVHITKLATPQNTVQAMYINAENPPPPPKIIPEPPQISETAPSPPHINDVVTVVEEADVQDMELDEAVALPPGVPVAEAKPIARPAGNHLPRDFQDALNIIFPGDQLPEHLAAHADPNLMLQYQYQYNMMYSNMQMQYDYNNLNQDIGAEEPELMKEEDAEVPPPPPPDLDDKEDLAMLGIDAEDMAAQTF